jgi:hypothetical protein
MIYHIIDRQTAIKVQRVYKAVRTKVLYLQGPGRLQRRTEDLANVRAGINGFFALLVHTRRVSASTGNSTKISSNT